MKYPFFLVADALRDDTQCYIHFAHTNPEPCLGIIQFGCHKTPKGYGYGPMIRDHYLIHFIRNGRGWVVTNNIEYTISSGQCFALCPHQMGYYEADQDNPWEYYWLGFEGAWAEDLMRRIGFAQDNPVIDIPQCEKVFAYLEEMAECDMKAENALYLNAMAQIVLSCLSSDSVPPARSASLHRALPGYLGNQYVTMIKSTIETSYNQQIQIDVLAQKLGYNRCYLTKLFKQYTGVSIKEYLLNVRMQQAILRIQMSKFTIKQIALECGFSDPLYFSRQFRRRFGVSPTEYCEKFDGSSASDAEETNAEADKK